MAISFLTGTRLRLRLACGLAALCLCLAAGAQEPAPAEPVPAEPAPAEPAPAEPAPAEPAPAEPAPAEPAPPPAITAATDPVTRLIHVTYAVPAGATEEVTVLCAWSPVGKGEWKPAKVMPFISETAQALAPNEDWEQWVKEGKIVERRAAGLQRTVVFNPYPEAQPGGKVDVDFRVVVQGADGAELASHVLHIQADNSDVVYVEDWTQVHQKDAVVAEPEPKGRLWSWRTDAPAEEGLSGGHGLSGKPHPEGPLPQLSYGLDLKGPYAVYVVTPLGKGGIGLRLSGDERTDTLASRRRFQEVLWRWTAMDRQNLVLSQPHGYDGWQPADLDYVKFVPLTAELLGQLESPFAGARDKLVAGYFEPYSWAFSEYLTSTLQHREPLTAFVEARIPVVDIQIGRFGMKAVYETRRTDPLLYSTIGDPIGAVAQPTTGNVGRMQQFTNTLDAELRYTRELGLAAHANFGASNSYPGTPLQSDFAKEHPDWLRGACLRYEVPEVRQYALSLYREALEIGATGLSIDFCRYPEAVDSVQTATAFMTELRQLADEFGAARGTRVPILVRFPGKGVRLWEHFDYAAWAKGGLVDYLVPSNIQGRHLHLDMTPYLEAVKDTPCKLLPCVDALGWGLPMPGPFLWRVARLYEAGVPGIYVYQADGRVLGRPEDRRCMRLLSSSAAVAQFWAEDARLRPARSKGIYITEFHQLPGWHAWERLRVWLEGIEMGPVELYLDDQLVTKADGPPYLLGTEENASDGVIPAGEHKLRIRAKDGDGWLEQTFTVVGAG